MKVLSLGWGVQSFTIAAMVALGELPPIYAALHADTGYEASGTYRFAAKWTGWLEEHGVKVVTARNAQPNAVVRHYGVNGKLGVAIPVYARTPTGMGMARRQCTGDWKIIPMRRWVSSELARLGLKKTKGILDQWLGISMDEFQRMRVSDVKYITNRYPLIDRKMARDDCILWLEKHGLEVPPKSACVFCPFHSDKSWRETKLIPEDWAAAVAADAEVRRVQPPFELYMHRSGKPLDEVDMRSAEEKGQLSLWENECDGICGV